MRCKRCGRELDIDNIPEIFFAGDHYCIPCWKKTGDVIDI